MSNFVKIALLCPLLLFALPEEGQVAKGEASFFAPNSETLIITASDKTVINYNSFNIQKEEVVQFVQPGAHATVLNRVTGKNPSEIFGQLRSNGKVLLINSRGIVFGPHSRVSTGSLIASTLSIEDSDFIRGKLRFRLDEQAKKSSIVNQGILTPAREGYVVLMSPHIFNEGVIAGRAAFFSDEIVTLDFSGDGLLSFAVDGELQSAIIEHLGKISASQGEVVMHLKTAQNLLKNVVNIEGLAIGGAIQKENGVIRIVDGSAIEADQIKVTGRHVEMGGAVERGSLSVTADTIALLGPLQGKEMLFYPATSLVAKGDIKATEGNIVFGGPVQLASPKIQFATGEKGDILFCSSLNGQSDLFLSAPNGMTGFEGPVGAEKRLSSLKVDARLIDQNQSVSTTGAISYTGEIYLGGKVGTKSSPITFNGPVIRDTVDTVTVSSGTGCGDISFIVSLDADVPTRTLVVNAGEGAIQFRGPIGKSGELSELSANGRLVSIGDVGAEKSGIGKKLYISAKEKLSFYGKTYHAAGQTWAAKEFYLKSRHKTRFIGAKEGVDLSRGTMHLEEGVHLDIDAKEGNVSLLSLNAAFGNDITLSADAGEVLVGGIGGGVGSVNISGKNVVLVDEIKAAALQIQAEESIVNHSKARPIDASADVHLNVKKGTIGLSENPLFVKTTGKIHVGAPTFANLIGSSCDGLLHSISSNNSLLMIFNGIEYYDLVLNSSFLPTDEQIMSLAPDLFVGAFDGGYLHTGFITPKKPSLYYSR